MSKLFKIILVFLFVFLIGGIGGFFMDSYIIPRLAASPKFENIGFIKKSNENVTIINKTEQVTIKEDDSINNIASRASASMVNIISTSQLGQSISGPGVVVTSDGVVITYRTAIDEKADSYEVFLQDSSNYKADFLGTDEFTNLSYLKIEKDNLTTIDFANSDDFRPGKKLIAIGNSSGEYQNRFSIGLLSNIDKTFNLSGTAVSFSDKMEGVFESDFENNKGYVGGPVISYNGEMVGIMGSLIMNNEEKYFQIPSNMVRKSLDRAISGNLENTPELGLYYLSITKEYAISNGLEYDRGALVYSASGARSLAVIFGSIADKTDLRIGDVIVKVDDTEIDLDNPFSNLLNVKNKGESVNLTIRRNGEEIIKTIEL